MAIFEFSPKKRKIGIFFKKEIGEFDKKVMKGFREKCEKPQFLGILVKNYQFWTVFGQNGRNGIFFQKSTWNIFSAFTSPN